VAREQGVFGTNRQDFSPRSLRYLLADVRI